MLWQAAAAAQPFGQQLQLHERVVGARCQLPPPPLTCGSRASRSPLRFTASTSWLSSSVCSLYAPALAANLLSTTQNRLRPDFKQEHGARRFNAGLTIHMHIVKDEKSRHPIRRACMWSARACSALLLLARIHSCSSE